MVRSSRIIAQFLLYHFEGFINAYLHKQAFDIKTDQALTSFYVGIADPLGEDPGVVHCVVFLGLLEGIGYVQFPLQVW